MALEDLRVATPVRSDDKFETPTVRESFIKKLVHLSALVPMQPILLIREHWNHNQLERKLTEERGLDCRKWSVDITG